MDNWKSKMWCNINYNRHKSNWNQGYDGGMSKWLWKCLPLIWALVRQISVNYRMVQASKESYIVISCLQANKDDLVLCAGEMTKWIKEKALANHQFMTEKQYSIMEDGKDLPPQSWPYSDACYDNPHQTHVHKHSNISTHKHKQNSDFKRGKYQVT